MIAVVWKNLFQPTLGVHMVDVPIGAEFLSAHNQAGQLAVWFRCDPDQEKERRMIAVCETGRGAPPSDESKFIGTALFDSGHYVLHVFEKV